MPTIIALNAMVELKKVGVNPTTLNKLSQAGAKVQMLPDRLTVSINGKTLEFKVLSSTLMHASKGDLLPADLAKLRVELTGFFGACLNDTAAPMAPGVSKPSPEFVVTPQGPVPQIASMKATGAATEQVVPVHMVPAVAAMMAHQPVSPSALTHGTKVPLIDAKGLYAPVRGTDDSSRYFMVGVFKNFRVAVRVKQSAMSVRVEGSLGDVHKILAPLGFKSGSSGGKSYMSAHIHSVDGVQRFQMYIGAMFGALCLGGFQLLTPMPDLNVIVGKGV